MGEVVDVKGGVAYLLFHRTSMCAKCGACGMIAGRNDITVTAKNTLHARVGDRVEVEFTAKNALQSSLIAYIFPLIMLFVGMWIGYSVPQTFFEAQDAAAAVMGIVFAAAAFVVLKLLDPVLRKKFSNVYSMIRIEDGN
jgi:sigma-E factor negative regulatory protein RseC